MTTVLFGAGATVPFFYPSLTTSFLTEQVFVEGKWDAVIKEYKRHTDHSIASVDEILSALQLVSELLAHVPQKKTFEVYAELIDKFASLGFDRTPGHNIMNTLFASIVESYRFGLGPEWRDVPFLFREIIIQSILEMEQNGKADEYSELCKLQNSFIRGITTHDERVSLVSLNYDNVLFDTIGGLGFKHCFDYVPQAGNMDCFDYYQFYEGKKVLYFPHGHSRFKRNGFDTIQYYDNPLEAESQRWAGIGDYTTTSSSTTLIESVFAYNFNTFITTGQTKDSALNLSPFDAYYQRLAKDLWDSDCLFIIGYSFGDEHINRLLHSLSYSKPFSRILVVDYIPSDINLANDIIHGSGLVRKIYDVFKPRVFFPNVSDISEYIPDNIVEINELGYGHLFESIYLYKSGMRSFLNGYQDIPFI